MRTAIETFSMRLFLDSPLGAALSVIATLAALACFVALWFKLLGHPRLKSLNEGRLRWLAIPLLFAMLGLPLVLMAIWSPYAGTLSSVTVEIRGEERFIEASFFSRGKHGGGTTTRRVMTMDGHIIGSHRSGSGCSKRNTWRGVGPLDGFEVERTGDQINLLHGHTLEEVADVTAALDRAYGEGQYQVQGVDGEGVKVLRRDGQEALFSLQALIPAQTTGLPAVIQRLPLLSSDVCATSREDKNPNRQKVSPEGITLLRARPVQRPSASTRSNPCVYDLASQPAVLALHSDVAFGDDGAHLLSALRADDLSRTLWTTDIAPALGAQWLLKEYTIHAPHARGARLCFWLVRNGESLSEVCVDARGGALLSAQVVF